MKTTGIEVSVELSPASVEANLAAKPAPISAEFMGIPTGHTKYDGGYEVTPSEEAQTLNTAGCVLSKDIVVDPIPLNYGRITWNGTVLTVY